jgi:hypothetical protein
MKNLISLFFLSLLTACSISVKSAATRFLSPEASGKFKGSFLSGYAEASKSTVSLTGNQTDNPVAIRESSAFNLITPTLGLHDQIDVFTYFSTDTPSVIGAKFQLLGDSKDKATAGNTSLSIAVSGGASKEEVDDDFFDIAGNTKTELKTKVTELSILVGHRVHKRAMLFLEANISQYRMEGNITSNDLAIDGKVFKYAGKINSLGAGIYLEKNDIFTRFQLSYQKVDWDKTQEDSSTLGSFAFGKHF